MSKNTICLWFERDAEEAARFYTETFPQSRLGAIHKAPSDYPDGSAGDTLVVEFIVAGIPCIGLNGGPQFKHSEAFSFQIATEDQEETDRDLERDCRKRRPGKPMWLVQRQVGHQLADHAPHPDRRDGQGRPGREACLRGHDAHEENRHCFH